MAADHGRHLRIEQRPRHRVHAQVENLEVLAGRVKDLEDLGIGHQLVERRQIHAFRQRIDRRGLFGASHLGQAELGPVGALAHELGVDRHELGAGQGLAEGREVIGRGDELHCIDV
jgi:hypothetical protein